MAYIARDFPERRKAIYEDIDRKDGPMWSQTYKLCLDVLKSLETNMDTYLSPPLTPEQAAAAQAVDEAVKKRTTAPPKDDPIFQPISQPKPGLRNQVEKAVAQAALHPNQPSQLSPAAKKAVDTAKQHLLTIQQSATGTDDTQGLFKDLALKFLRSPVGWPFRQHYARRLAHAVLGAPYGEPSLFVNAACALGMLAVHSLREDKYGHVQRDVAALIRALTGLVKKVEGFRGERLGMHWTDVDGQKEGAAAARCPEVDEVVEAVRDALRRLVEAFGPYARDLRLSLADMRLAREAAGIVVGEEMEEVGWR